MPDMKQLAIAAHPCNKVWWLKQQSVLIRWSLKARCSTRFLYVKLTKNSVIFHLSESPTHIFTPDSVRGSVRDGFG